MKQKRKYDSTAKKLKAIGIVGGLQRKGEWQTKREAESAGPRSSGNPAKMATARKAPLKIEQSSLELVTIAQEKASGMTDHELATKYGVSDGYITEALRKFQMNSKVGREILKGVLLENAVACGMHARAHIEELNPMQAAVATGIFSSRFAEIDKLSQSQPVEVDFAEIARVGNVIKELKQSIGGISDGGGSVLDI